MANDILTIPIVQQALFFLQEAESASGIKITEKGALGRNFVQSFWDKHLKASDNDLIFRPSKEAECPEVTKIHFLLSDSRYVKKSKGKVYITEKGKSVLSSKKIDALYYDLLTSAIYKWNWGYEDRYPKFSFIQQASEQLIQTLLFWPSNTVTADKIYDSVFAGHADLVPEDNSTEIDLTEINLDLRKRLHHCFNLRFFQRFCVPFGVLIDEHDHFLNKKPTDTFEKTAFFINSFSSIINNCADKKDLEIPIKKINSNKK